MTFSKSAVALEHALDAGQAAQRFMRDRLEEYSQDEILRSAIERQLAILGEALSRLRKLDPARAERIPGIIDIVGFRNVLVHQYFILQDEIIWLAVRDDLPGLITTISLLFSEIRDTRSP